MAQLSFDGVGIEAIAASVPKNCINNLEYTEHFAAADVAEIVKKTGIERRRFAPDGMCASDLCFSAAESLLLSTGCDRSEIDLLIFVSQTPDYKMPATAILLQDRLALSKNVAAFDISLGCSAYVYALSIAYSMMQTGSFRKALLLDGETRSRVYSPKDRKTAFLFGDAGSATLISNEAHFGKSFFSLHSDGSRADYIKVYAGGARIPSSNDTLKEQVVDEHGNVRSLEHGYMSGTDVFNFVISEIPEDIKQLLNYAGLVQDKVQHFFLHQANKYMNDYLAKKLRISHKSVPNSIADFGNTSSVSIPLTIVSNFGGRAIKESPVLLSGFGVGMSWASCIMDLSKSTILQLVEI